MKRMIAALALALVATSGGGASAQERVTLGWGRLFTNDLLGDGRDRWRTGAYTVSRVRGESWTGALPATAFEILEFRFRGEVVSPASLTAPVAGDRRYAGLLSFGLHTHFDMGGVETSAGLDVVASGPQTRLSGFHEDVHDALGLSPLGAGVVAGQIADDAHPTVVIEAGRTIAFGPATLRPFVEGQAGLETLVRVGGDLNFGGYSRGALMLRDGTTGQRYRAVEMERAPGLSMTLGGDIARVFDSALLPAGGAATLTETRHRLRAGLHWQGAASEVFYGVTWLGKEFDQQPEGQMLGSIHLRLNF